MSRQKIDSHRKDSETLFFFVVVVIVIVVFVVECVRFFFFISFIENICIVSHFHVHILHNARRISYVLNTVKQLRIWFDEDPPEKRHYLFILWYGWSFVVWLSHEWWSKFAHPNTWFKRRSKTIILLMSAKTLHIYIDTTIYIQQFEHDTTQNERQSRRKIQTRRGTKMCLIFSLRLILWWPSDSSYM